MKDDARKLLNDLAELTCPQKSVVLALTCLERGAEHPCLACRAKQVLADPVVFAEEPGRYITRNGKAHIVIHRPEGGATPHKTDLLTKRIIHLLNTYGED